MSGIDKLRKIGVQKIHEDTHISRAHVEIIFQGNFEELHSGVQLNGFLSILEREYNVDLNELRAKAKDNFEDLAKNPKMQISTTNLFFVENKKKKLTFFYIVLSATVFVVFAYFNTDILNNDQAQQEQNSKIEIEANNIEPTQLVEENITIVDENSTSLDTNETQIEEIEEVIEEKTQEILKEVQKEEIKEASQKKVTLEQDSKESFLKIIPKSKVWIGYIELATGKKNQTVSTNELTIDSTKDWLLTFGHGHLNIEVDGKTNKYQTAKNLRFIYKDGELKELSLDEFKALNSGKLW